MNPSYIQQQCEAKIKSWEEKNYTFRMILALGLQQEFTSPQVTTPVMFSPKLGYTTRTQDTLTFMEFHYSTFPSFLTFQLHGFRSFHGLSSWF